MNVEDAMEHKIIPPLLVYDGADREFLWQANGITKKLTLCSGEDDQCLLTAGANMNIDRLIKSPDDNTHIMKQPVTCPVKTKTLERGNSNKTTGICGNKENENITLFHNNSVTTNLVFLVNNKPTTQGDGAVTHPQTQNIYMLQYGQYPFPSNISYQPTQNSNFHNINNQNQVQQTLVNRELNCRIQGNNHQINKDLKQSKMQDSSAKVKSYPCSFCGKTFTLKRVLIQHAIIHSGERPYGCSFCSAVFNRKGNLKRHEQMHTGESPYMCSYCGGTYRDKRALVRHEATKHSKQKQVRCSYCRAKFYDIGILHRHLKIHQKPKTYACTYCDVSYRDEWLLIRHEARKHKALTPHSCSYCGAKFVDNKHIALCKAQLQANTTAHKNTTVDNVLTDTDTTSHRDIWTNISSVCRNTGKTQTNPDVPSSNTADVYT